MCWWSDFLSSCAWFERAMRQTSTNSAHCYSQLVCSTLNSSLCCPSLALETFPLDHSPRLNELWQPFLGICFPFAQFLWSLASSPKSDRESSFSDFLCTWDRQYYTVPQASDRSYLGPLQSCWTARKQTSGMLWAKANPWESDNV